MSHDTTTQAPLMLGTAHLTSTVRPATGRFVVHLTGEVDIANSAPLPAALVNACAGDSDTELDVSELAFCDLSGARALLEARRKLTAAGTCVTMRGATMQLRWLLSFIGAGQDLFADRPPAPTTPPRRLPADRATVLPGRARREHPSLPRHRLPGTTSQLLD
jgi:anti-anti-sigma factor